MQGLSFAHRPALAIPWRSSGSARNRVIVLAARPYRPESETYSHHASSECQAAVVALVPSCRRSHSQTLPECRTLQQAIARSEAVEKQQLPAGHRRGARPSDRPGRGGSGGESPCQVLASHAAHAGVDAPLPQSPETRPALGSPPTGSTAPLPPLRLAGRALLSQLQGGVGPPWAFLSASHMHRTGWCVASQS